MGYVPMGIIYLNPSFEVSDTLPYVLGTCHVKSCD